MAKSVGGVVVVLPDVFEDINYQSDKRFPVIPITGKAHGRSLAWFDGNILRIGK